jgi:hypothetical protein
VSKGKRRLKALAERAKRRAAKHAQYVRRRDSLPSEETNYGRRWWARRRGEPMASRSHETPPWYSEVWSRRVGGDA